MTASDTPKKFDLAAHTIDLIWLIAKIVLLVIFAKAGGAIPVYQGF